MRLHPLDSQTCGGQMRKKDKHGGWGLLRPDWSCIKTTEGHLEEIIGSKTDEGQTVIIQALKTYDLM